MSDTTTPAEAEATRETVEIEFFGRSWTLPAQSRLSHARKLRVDPSNIGIVDAYLSADDLAALEEIDPTGDELDAFTDKMGEAIGFLNSGNS